ncbi:hypothetical protein Poli38472_011513 [Pythium oligandrum]|uniref:Uncharacterized protein n=1 Tax=Pythium oligandrum TaxID=41045 RepID=A0A8K1FNG9_PYTOL|nr:hypothetical protein Poli38472_011513 [Pythium oligandrum]|eukprot:TMW64633.1 hypothetical protein Poli38472_011513 [Pythium oligandrum]
MDEQDASPRDDDSADRQQQRRTRHQRYYQAENSTRIITSLAEAHGYESDEDAVQTTVEGALVPRSSRKRKFPRAQRRFRDRLQLLEERLRLDVNGLQQEILDLQLQHRLSQTRQRVQRLSRTDTAIQIVREYFDAFHHGLAEPPRSSAIARRQERFFTGSLDQNMQFGRYHDGGAVLAELWRRYTLCHRNYRVHLRRIDVCVGESPNAPTLRVEGVLCGYITHDTLVEVFPRVLEFYPHLAARMIGAFVEYPCTLMCHFNEEGRIAILDSEVDFVAPLAHVLGDVRDVALVLNDSTIRDQCLIGYGPVSEEEVRGANGNTYDFSC